MAPILAAVEAAAHGGLRLPLVYNTGGYDSVATLHLLDGVVDVYMPDAKFSDRGTALALSGVDHYPQVNRACLREMHRQVRDLLLDDEGVAVRGLVVRHLVLPGGLSGTEEVLRFVAREISLATYLNLMDQYRPCHLAAQTPELEQPLRWSEYRRLRQYAKVLGFTRLAS